jgi:hypothetical protein
MSLILNGTTGLSDVDGSASTPAIRGTDTNTGIFFPAADTIAFAEGGAESMRIDSSGNVGIGTSSPSAKLSIAGSTASDYTTGMTFSKSGGNTYAIAPDANDLFVRSVTGGTEVCRFTYGGNLLVGTTNSSNTAGSGVKLVPDPTFGATICTVVGSATSGSFSGFNLYSTGSGSQRFYADYGGTLHAVSTSIAAISDQSLKENVVNIEPSLDKVMSLRPVRFDWKEEMQIEQKQIQGFIAQEVESVLPDLVYGYQYNDTETKKSIKMGDMIPTLVKAIQEQQAIINDLKARIEALEKK